MKFAESANGVVYPSIIERSKLDIEAVNKWVDELRGISISVQHLSGGQSGPYTDAVYSGRIFCHWPNSGLTNGPTLRSITEKQARQIARIFIHDFVDEPKPDDWSSPRLTVIRPEANPCGLEEREGFPEAEVRSATWYVQIERAYTG